MQAYYNSKRSLSLFLQGHPPVKFNQTGTESDVTNLSISTSINRILNSIPLLRR